ncbi:MFS transporter, partial [Ochrobactrum sp. MR34]|nr:MFS transporter [Ochrobactrum sp. MR34]
RWMFVVPVGVALAGLLMSERLLPPSRLRNNDTKLQLDPLGALLATAAIVLTSYGLIRSGGQSWSSPHVWMPLLAGLLLLI